MTCDSLHAANFFRIHQIMYPFFRFSLFVFQILALLFDFILHWIWLILTNQGRIITFPHRFTIFICIIIKIDRNILIVYALFLKFQKLFVQVLGDLLFKFGWLGGAIVGFQFYLWLKILENKFSLIVKLLC